MNHYVLSEGSAWVILRTAVITDRFDALRRLANEHYQAQTGTCCGGNRRDARKIAESALTAAVKQLAALPQSDWEFILRTLGLPAGTQVMYRGGKLF